MRTDRIRIDSKRGRLDAAKHDTDIDRELTRRGFVPTADRDPRARIAAALTVSIADEIAADPDGRGYAGKSKQEVADLLNAPYDKDATMSVKDENGDIVAVTISTRTPPRFAQICAGIPYAPNAATAGDIP